MTVVFFLLVAVVTALAGGLILGGGRRFMTYLREADTVSAIWVRGLLLVGGVAVLGVAAVLSTYGLYVAYAVGTLSVAYWLGRVLGRVLVLLGRLVRTAVLAALDALGLVLGQIVGLLGWEK